MAYSQAELNEALDTLKAPFLDLLEKVKATTQKDGQSSEVLVAAWNARDAFDNHVDMAIAGLLENTK